jgi:F-type H+-transporting ATPase subunit epsilon
MSDPLLLEVLTPEGRVFSSRVSEVQFPSAFRGTYGILPDHTAVMTPLGDGTLTCLREGQKVQINLGGGFAEVGPDHVTVLAREASVVA